MRYINFYIKNSIYLFVFLLINACQQDALSTKLVDIQHLILDIKTIEKVVPYIQKSKSRKAAFSDFPEIQEDYKEMQKLWQRYEQSDRKMPQTLTQIDELTTGILLAIDEPLAELITKIKSSTVQKELIAWKKRQLKNAEGKQKNKVEQDLQRLLAEYQKISVQPMNCSDKKFPRNATWGKVEAHYRNCISFPVERDDILSIHQFVKLLKHTDSGKTALTSTEASYIEWYYMRLAFCSDCKTVDCYNCRKLVKYIEEAKVIAHDKDFQL